MGGSYNFSTNINLDSKETNKVYFSVTEDKLENKMSYCN